MSKITHLYNFSKLKYFLLKKYRNINLLFKIIQLIVFIIFSLSSIPLKLIIIIYFLKDSIFGIEIALNLC